MLTLYKYLSKAAYAFSYPWLKKKYAVGFDERRGIYTKEKCLDNAIWVHAVSVGEVQAALPFISHVKSDPNAQVNVLLSTTTITGAEVAKQWSGKYDALIFFPWDIPRFITRALDSIKPRAFISVETEIWPMMMNMLKQRVIPSFLINGRISDKSYRRMSYISSFWGKVFSCFESIMLRDEQDAYRLKEFGVSLDKLSVTGDCKIDAMRERKVQCDILQEFKHARPIFIAGSTHMGEEEQVLEAFRILKERISGIKLIVVPRHPERATEVYALSSQIGKTVYYSEFDDYEFINDWSDWEILIVDKIGALFCLYSISSSAFIGGSLVPKGGQNIMEPALFGVPLCHGKYMSDFRHVSDQFVNLGISKIVETAEEIADFWFMSLDADFKHKTMRLSENWFVDHGGAADKNWNIIKNHIR